MSASGDASALDGLAATRFAHNCLRAYSSPKPVTTQDDLSPSLSQRTADPMSGNGNGYPSGVMEMSVWRADRHNASKHNTVQHSAELDLVNCPRWHDDKALPAMPYKTSLALKRPPTPQLLNATPPTHWRRNGIKVATMLP